MGGVKGNLGGIMEHSQIAGGGGKELCEKKTLIEREKKNFSIGDGNKVSDI